MASPRGKRRLTTIFAADVEGYSRLMHVDEEATLATLNTYREIIDGLIARHDGRIFGTGGDSVLAEFGSAVEAVRAAISIQEELRVRNAEAADERKMNFRIGITVGDVMVEGDNLFGDGVNVAARLEGLAEPGGICISGSAYEQVKSKLTTGFEDVGAQRVKNIDDPVQVFRLLPGSATAAASSKAQRQAKRLRVIAAAAAAIVVLIGGGYWLQDNWDAGPEALDSQRIAVLPFTNISRDPDDQYFADGMTEELISKLSRIAGLAVIARTSAMSYKGTDKRVDEIGRELGVGTILEGSVRKAGDALRITVQLIDVTTQQHLWSQDYDRAFEDIFVIQTDIAQRVADALQVTLLSGEQQELGAHGTDSLEAYNLYLKGLYQFNKYSEEGYNKAVRFFEQAIEQDPNYAQPWASLAFTLEGQGYFQYRPAKEVYPESESAVLKALELDDGVVEAYLVLGLINSEYYWDWPAAERAYRRAIALNPNHAMARWAYAIAYLTPMGRFDEAIIEMEQAQKLDPLSPFAVGDMAWVFYHARRYDRAVEQALKALEMDPNTVNILRVLGVVYVEKAMYDEAIEALQKAVVASGNWSGAVGILGWGYARAGRTEEALQQLEQLRQRSKEEYIPAVHFFLVHFGLGETDKALDLLEQAYEERTAELVYVYTWPLVDALRAEPRFIEVMTKIGVLQQ